MSVKDTINADLKKALLEGDKTKATILRGLKSTLLNAEIAAGKRDSGLDETEVTALLQKEVKSRKESVTLYEQGGAPEKAAQEKAEIDAISTYLPKQMGDDELEAIVDKTVAEFDEVTPQIMGQIIGKVKQQVGSAADGGRIAAVVKRKVIS